MRCLGVLSGSEEDGAGNGGVGVRAGRDLFLPPTARGRDAVILHDLLPLAAAPDWKKQRRLWRRLGDDPRCGRRRGPGDRPGSPAGA